MTPERNFALTHGIAVQVSLAHGINRGRKLGFERSPSISEKLSVLWKL
jgi:hypothetical protein